MRRILVVGALAALAVGCGGGGAGASSSGGGSSAGASSGGGSSSGAGATSGGSASSRSNNASGGSSGGTSAITICDQACAALVTCGAAVTPTCSTDCQAAGSAYVGCIQAANNGCNGIALCYVDAVCPGQGPAGTATCAATATCEGTCNVTNPTTACGCGCVAAMSPTTAFNLLVNNQCANVATCPSCNPLAFDGAACNACAQACVSADACSSS